MEEVDADSLAFAERRGFVKERHLFASTLDLTEFDASPLAAVVTASETAGLHFTSYAAFGSNDVSLALLLDLLVELYQDEPGRTGFPALTLDQLRAWSVDRPNWDPSGILLAVDRRRDDRWVAVAHVTLEGNGRAYNTFTGVRRAYRGRGLAQVMKVKAAEYARAKGATGLRTHNDSLNAPMLAVNRKLGYRPESGSFTLVRRLDRGAIS